MDWRRTGGHLVLWGLAASGAWLAFDFFPQGFVLPRNNFMSLLIIPAILYWLYSSSGFIRMNRKSAFGAVQINELIQKADYGMIAHPICVADILLAWGIFFYYPDIRILVSVIWITIMMSFWLRIERNALTEAGVDYKKEDDLTP